MDQRTESEPQVFTPVLSDWPQVTAALAAAFRDDPVFRWLVPHAARRPGALERYFEIETRDIALGFGFSIAAYAGESVAGAALIFPPDRWRMPVGSIVRHVPAYVRTLRWRTPHAVGLLAAVERRHLQRRHYYFGYIGVAPRAQGRGIGTTMVTPALERCDAENLPAYLEASSPDNARLYERLGFVTLETIAPFGAPPIRLMVREPR